MKKGFLTKLLTLLVVVGLSVTAGIAGTLAYLQDSDDTVNVMTTHNVYIEQIEQERGENGKLVDFEQKKPAFPAVGEIKWADAGVDVNGIEYKVFDDDLKNVVDKIVTVKNTGDTNAYVRTIIAIEAPGGDPNNLIHVNVSPEGLTYTTWTSITIDGIDYAYSVFTYEKALKPNEISTPSLMQVFLDSKATNEDCEAFGETWEIVAISQGTQEAGFADAKTALNTAFGEVDETNLPKWIKEAIEDYENPGLPENPKASYNGEVYDDIYEAIAEANANGGGTITLLGSTTIDKPVEIASNITIKSKESNGDYAVLTRSGSYTGTMFTVKAGGTLTVENVTLNGEGATATGNLIATEGNGSIVLNEGTVLKENHGAHAVSLATRGGGSLTLNGASIINNSSDSGAIWGGGNIIVNDGSKINNNSSTGIGGAIRMVGSCNLTMNGGEISNNTAAGDGGAIWGYGSSTYNFNGGKMSNNESAGTGGAIYTGTYSVINISGDFEMTGNKATNSGAIRLTDHTSMNMTGGKVSGNMQNGESNAFNTWNNSISITGGELSDDISYVGGLGLTIGAAKIDGVVYYDLSTNHNTAYLTKDFNGFKFKVNEADEHFDNFNFKPAADYVYAEGDEDKLICQNEGYFTYWDNDSKTFKLKAN